LPVPSNKKLELLGKPKNMIFNYILISVENKGLRLKINSNVYDSRFNLIGKITDIIGNVNKPYAVVKPIIKEKINFNDVFFVETKKYGNRHNKR
jgi:rRNA processing protein Gar1